MAIMSRLSMKFNSYYNERPSMKPSSFEIRDVQNLTSV